MTNPALDAAGLAAEAERSALPGHAADDGPVAWTQPSCLAVVASGGSGEMWARRDVEMAREFIDQPDMPDDVPLYARPAVLPPDVEKLLREAGIKAGMLRMGEPIAFGSEAALIENLADALSAQAAEIARMREAITVKNEALGRIASNGLGHPLRDFHHGRDKEMLAMMDCARAALRNEGSRDDA